MPQNPDYNFIIIGLNPPPEKLKKLIRRRLEARLRTGLIDEVRKLKKSGLSWKKLEAFGLEYRNVSLYLQKKLSRQKMIRKLETDIWHYAKRQMTWFKRDERIRWLTRKSASKLRLNRGNISRAP